MIINVFVLVDTIHMFTVSWHCTGQNMAYWWLLSLGGPVPQLFVVDGIVLSPWKLCSLVPIKLVSRSGCRQEVVPCGLHCENLHSHNFSYNQQDNQQVLIAFLPYLWFLSNCGEFYVVLDVTMFCNPGRVWQILVHFGFRPKLQ